MRPERRTGFRFLVGLLAFLFHRVQVQEVGRGLGHEPDKGARLGRGQGLGIDTADVHRAGLAGSRSLERPQE